MTITIPFTLTPAQKTKWSAIVSGLSAGAAYLFTLDPSDQVKVLAPIIAILPPGWHGYVGTAMKALSIASLIYAFISAHKGTPLAQMSPADLLTLAQRLNDEIYAKQPAPTQNVVANSSGTGQPPASTTTTPK